MRGKRRRSPLPSSRQLKRGPSVGLLRPDTFTSLVLSVSFSQLSTHPSSPPLYAPIFLPPGGVLLPALLIVILLLPSAPDSSSSFSSAAAAPSEGGFSPNYFAFPGPSSLSKTPAPSLAPSFLLSVHRPPDPSSPPRLRLHPHTPLILKPLTSRCLTALLSSGALLSFTPTSTVFL